MLRCMVVFLASCPLDGENFGFMKLLVYSNVVRNIKPARIERGGGILSGPS